MFLTDNFALPAIARISSIIAKLYKYRWQVELFCKWIEQHLRIEAVCGASENAVEARIWSASCVYVAVAIVEQRLGVTASLYEIPQILSLTLFEKTELFRLFHDIPRQTEPTQSANQLNLFD